MWLPKKQLDVVIAYPVAHGVASNPIGEDRVDAESAAQRSAPGRL